MKTTCLSFDMYPNDCGIRILFLSNTAYTEYSYFFAWNLAICIILLVIVLLLSGTLYLERKKKLEIVREADKAIQVQEKNKILQKLVNKQFDETIADSRVAPLNHRWDWLKKEIDKIHNHFTIRLKVRFPKLSEDEIRLCCLIRIGIDTHGITRYLDISKEYLRTKKSRLAKSLKIRNDKGQFEQFILSF